VIDGGYAAPNPIGRVERGDPVTPGGAWVGAGLRLEHGFQ